MLNTAVTAADAVRNSAIFDPWGAIDVEAGPVVADLKSGPARRSYHGGVTEEEEQLSASLMLLR